MEVKDTVELCGSLANGDNDRFSYETFSLSSQLNKQKRLVRILFVLFGICLLVAIISLAYSIKTSHESSPTSTASTAKVFNGSGGPQSLKALEKTNKSLEMLKAEIIDQQRSLNKTVEDLKGLKTRFTSNQHTSSQTLMKLNETVRDNQAKTLREIQKLRTDLEAQLDRAQQTWDGLNISIRAASRYFNATMSQMLARQVNATQALKDLLTTQMGLIRRELDSFIAPLPPGPCSSPDTLNMTEPWRKDNSGSDIRPGGSYNCDAQLFDDTQWFRITGAAGNRILDSCPPKFSCGSRGGIWTNATMPAVVGQVLKVPVHGSWSHCTWYPFDDKNSLTVQKCSYAHGDFVYKIDGKTGCAWSVCGMD